MITVAVSGGFDPLHIGHVRMFKEAKKLGHKLIVILNNDNFLKLKKGFIFMPENERKEMISSFEFVDEVYVHRPSNSEDLTVCEALEKIQPNIFANGGDRLNDNTPEIEVCDRLNIKIEFNVGGGKIQSSSDMVKNSFEQLELNSHDNRPWGSYKIILESKEYKVKIIKVNPGGILSLQKHKYRNEHWYIVKGEASVRINKDAFTLKEQESIYINKGDLHRLENKTNFPLELIEIQTGDYFGEDDIERLEDVYGRL